MTDSDPDPGAGNAFSECHIADALRLFLITVILILTHITSSRAEPVNKGKRPITAVIHCNYSPVSYWNNTTNTPSGFFVDIMDIVAARTGLQVSYICRDNWDAEIPAIETGEADLGVLMKTKQREKKLLFSTPIDTIYLSYFARSESDIDPERVFSDHILGVINRGITYEQLRDREWVKLHIYGDYQEALFGLLAGEVSLFAGEESMFLKNMRETGLENRIKKVGKPFFETQRCLAIRKDNVQLLELINKTLKGFVGGPEYQRIYLKWYGVPTPYWTNRRVLTVSGLFLIIAISGIAFWRYVSISKMNTVLIRAMAERKEAEVALRTTEERLSLALKAAGQSVYDFDLVTGEGIVSPEYALMLGYDPAEFHETVPKWLKRLHPDDREPEAAVYRAYLEGEIPEYKVEFRHKTKDGNWKWMLSLGKIIKRDSDGNPLRMIGTHTDITERKEAEEALRRSRDQMETRVLERTAELRHEIDHRTIIEAELKLHQEQLRKLYIKHQSRREEERAKIAREIHDELGQVMAAVRMNVAWMKMEYSDHQKIIEKSSEILELIDGTITSVRRICSELRPDVLDHLGLGAAIAWQAEEFTRRSGIPCDVTVKEGIKVDSDSCIALFRIFQEALTNVMRHADATEVEASLRDERGKVILKIIDNGKGITEEDKSKPGGFGLLGMRERVYPWRGSVSIKGSPNKGTRIEVILPQE
ncbi:MAG: transporter substrate-binding domain-containing protein [Nitrospirae bacterium]|nr:transporter substrate-binding domain-containing protein [Nitrospirota bacterium]